MRRDVFRAGMIVLAVAAAGCGGSATRVERPEAPREAAALREPATLLPADTFAYARIDVEALRSSPYAGTVARWYHSWGALLTEEDEDAELFARVVELLAERAEVVVLAAYGCEDGSGCEPGIAVVFRGDFRGEPLWAMARGLPDAERLFDEREVEGRRALVSDSPDELAGVRVDDRTWLWAPLAWAKRALRAEQPSALEGTLAPLAERVDVESAAVTVLLDPPPGEASSVFEELAVDGAAGVDQAALQLDVADGFRMDGLATMPSAAEAEQLSAGVQRSLAESSEHPLVILLGVDELVDRSSVTTDGRTVHLRTRLEDLEVRQLLFHWEKLAGAAAAFFGGDHEASLGGLLGMMPAEEPPPAPPPLEEPPPPAEDGAPPAEPMLEH